MVGERVWNCCLARCLIRICMYTSGGCGLVIVIPQEIERPYKTRRARTWSLRDIVLFVLLVRDNRKLGKLTSLTPPVACLDAA